MNRRELVLFLAGAVSAASAVRAEQKTLPVIGFLSAGSLGPVSAGVVTAFRQGLGEAGFLEGRDVAIEYRWAEGRYDRLPALAADLARRSVDVIVTTGGEPVATAAKAATPTIPIVSGFGRDPVESGLVASFARPGGNLTGFSVFTNELTAKRFELLYELVPRAGVVALLVNPNFQQTERIIRDAQAAAGVKRGTAQGSQSQHSERDRRRFLGPCPAFRRRAACWRRSLLPCPSRRVRRAGSTLCRAGDL